MNKVWLYLVVLCTIFVAAGCDNSKTKKNYDIKKYNVAIIKTPKTSSLKGDTKIEYYDSNLRKVAEKAYSYGGVGRTNFGLPFKKGNDIYELSIGYGIDKRDCKVLRLSMETGEMKEYGVCKYTNNIYVDDKYIYGIANLNGDTTISKTSIKDNKKNEVVVKKDICTECCKLGTDVYRLGDWENGKIFLKQVKFNESKSREKKIELTEYIDEDTEPVSYYDYKDKMYIPTKDGLLCVHENKVNHIKLKILEDTNPELLRAVGNQLYIAVCSFLGENNHSLIVKYNMDTDQIETEYEIESSIVQFDVVKNNLYVLNFDNELIKYRFDSDKIFEKKRIMLTEQEDEYVSAMFAK